MSDVFTASNGMQFTTVGGQVRWAPGHNYDQVSQGLREYFLHEAGLWRSPDYPEYWVMRVPGDDDGDGRCVLVINKLTGDSWRMWEKLTDKRLHESSHNSLKVAAAWFEAHPEKKPWHGAKPGEVWRVGGELALVGSEMRGDRYFILADESTYGLDEVSEAHLVWPEVSDE